MYLSKSLAFLLYIVIIVSIGLISSHKIRNTSAYVLGNRGLNYWITAISANASDMSVWLFLGFPVAVYTQGLIQIWTAVGLIFFMFLNWHFVAPRLRRATEKYDSLTLFSFFEKRLNDESHLIRITGAIFSTFFLTIYIAAGLTGMGYLFESLFNINYYLGCIAAVFAVLLYTSIGGFTAICYADFAQGVFLLIVIVAVPALIFFSPLSSAHNLSSLQNALNKPFLPTDFPSIIEALILAVGWGVGYFGQPHILNKFMAINDPDELNKSKWLGTLWQILALGGAVCTGLAAAYFFSTPPVNNELIFVDMVNSLFSPFLASFVLCAILAATLSTVDSQILVVASVLAEDLYKTIINKNPSVKAELLASRLASLAVCLVALSIALVKPASIFNMVYYCWVAIGCAFGPLVIASLYLKNLNKIGAFMGMLVGGLIGALWITLGTSVSATIPGFIMGFLAIFACSYLTKRTSLNKLEINNLS